MAERAMGRGPVQVWVTRLCGPGAKPRRRLLVNCEAVDSLLPRPPTNLSRRAHRKHHQITWPAAASLRPPLPMDAAVAFARPPAPLCLPPMARARARAPAPRAPVGGVGGRGPPGPRPPTPPTTMWWSWGPESSDSRSRAISSSTLRSPSPSLTPQSPAPAPPAQVRLPSRVRWQVSVREL